jgi:hypothetical protein
MNDPRTQNAIAKVMRLKKDEQDEFLRAIAGSAAGQAMDKYIALKEMASNKAERKAGNVFREKALESSKTMKTEELAQNKDIAMRRLDIDERGLGERRRSAGVVNDLRNREAAFDRESIGKARPWQWLNLGVNTLAAMGERSDARERRQFLQDIRNLYRGG